MTLLWVICGAGRGVGKTTLAMKLCEVLPNCMYAKQGHGVRKAHKPEFFFETDLELEAFIQDHQESGEHLVAESNALARMGRGDVIIFVNGVEGKTEFRDDVQTLREKAVIDISCDSRIADWKKLLSQKVPASLCNKICDALASQKQYLFGVGPVVRSKIWFESAGERTFGMGLARLLEAVDRFGTLQEAAKAANMSYRYAWNLIRTAENHLGQSLICRHAGGREGGGSALSGQGRRMLDAFQQMNEDVCAYADARFAELFDDRSKSAVEKNQ